MANNATNNLKALSKKLPSLFLTLFLAFLLTGCAIASRTSYMTANFTIQYRDNPRTDYDNNCTLDEIKRFGNVLEQARLSYVTDFGFPAPPHSTVYIKREGGGAHGGVDWMDFDPMWLGSRWLKDGTVNNFYFTSATQPMVGASHELFHVIQWSTIDRWNIMGFPSWVIEGQSTMMQDKIRDAVDINNLDRNNYYNEVSNYLANPEESLTSISYSACLFWTYFTERYGGITDPYFTHEPWVGVDIIREFWDQAKANPKLDGKDVINRALKALWGVGCKVTFEDVFRNFIVANYVKDLTGIVPAMYTYIDEAQPPGHYPRVKLTLDKSLGTRETYNDIGSVNRTAARYYRIKPSTGSFVVNVQVTQSTNDQLSYHLLLIDKNKNLVQEYRLRARNFAKTVVNRDYEEIVLIIGGLENTAAYTAYYNYIFSTGTTSDVTLNIWSPKSNRPARVDPSNPGRFLSVVDVSFRGSPVPGLETSHFEADVGFEKATIETSGYGEDLYFLFIKAPDLPPGEYHLDVGLYPSHRTGVGDREEKAVKYGILKAANVLVIDESDSMNGPWSTKGKISAAQLAAKLYVDSFLDSDKMGVVSYYDSAVLQMELQNITPEARTKAKDKIDGIEPEGWTSMGAGLQLAHNELISRMGLGYIPVIILISDGLENVLPWVRDVYPSIRDFGTEVHTVAIGEDANHTLLQDLADGTLGTWHFADELDGGDLPNDLTDIYRYIAEKVSNQQRVLAYRGDGAYWNNTIPIDREAKEAVFVFSYNSSSPIKYAELRDPANNPAPPSFLNSSDTPAGAMGYMVWRVQQPQPGDWQIRGEGNARTHYLVEAAVRHDLTFDLIIPRESGVMGEPVLILTSLAEDGPVLDADVLATVTTPSGNLTRPVTRTIRLFDDGEHGDGSADDGVYGNFYTQTSQNGTYVVRAVAEGSTPSTGAFRRETRGAFYIEADMDTDGDGMPDTWEKQHGLDPGDVTGDNGADGDPDNDYLSNIYEFLHGTDPMNSDTDGGGESDGSEVKFRRDPTDPEDDTIVTPTSIYVHPGNTFNEVYFSVTQEYVSMTLYRWTTDPFSYSLIRAEPTGFYNDTNLINYRTYYYRILGVDDQGAWSGYTAMDRGTPKIDTEPPEGVVLINYGAEKTQTPRVTLSLLSSEDTMEMMVTNDPSFEGAVWEPFVTEKEWVLKEGRGVQTVFVLFKDGEGNVSPAADDSILLETLLGDVNDDRKVNIIDLVIIAKALWTEPGDERWNPVVDLDKNGEINMIDIALAAADFGKSLDETQSPASTIDANSPTTTNAKTVALLLTPVTAVTPAICSSKRKRKTPSYINPK